MFLTTITSPTAISPRVGTETTTPDAAAGVGATPTTMRPTATIEQLPSIKSTDCCAFISSCVAKIVEFVRSCFAKLPLIGRLFAGKKTVQVPNTPQPMINPPVGQVIDAQRLNMIRRHFLSASATQTFPVPAEGTVNALLDVFRAMNGSPAVQMQAFQDVLSACNSTDEIALRFYLTLSPEIQNQFNHQVWLGNNRNDEGLGSHYGMHAIMLAPRGPLAKRAAAALQVILSV